MSERKFTHKARIYGIPCYFNEMDMSVEGTNWFYDKLIDFGTFIDTTFNISDGFYITDLKKIEKAD